MIATRPSTLLTIGVNIFGNGHSLVSAHYFIGKPQRQGEKNVTK